MNKPIDYEVLCVDNVGNCVVETEQALCYALLSNSALFKDGKLSGDDKISDH